MLKAKVKNRENREKRVFFTNLTVLNSKFRGIYSIIQPKSKFKNNRFVIFTNIFSKITKNTSKNTEQTQI